MRRSLKFSPDPLFNCSTVLPEWCIIRAGAGIAQLAERQPSKLNVAGSNPVPRSLHFGRRFAQLHTDLNSL